MNGAISESIAGEGSLLLVSFLFGAALMLFYDVIRIFRHMRKHGTILMAVEDMLYWLFCAVGIFAMLYRENEGLLRWFVLGGVAIGMLVENTYISPWVVRIFVKILRIWQKIFGKIFGVVEKPGKKMFGFFKKELKKIKKAVKIGLSKQ